IPLLRRINTHAHAELWACHPGFDTMGAPGGALMRLGIVSDTHGHVQNALAAVRMLESLEVDEILHCGDIGSTEIPRLFKNWPTHFVLGNCDPDAGPLSAAIGAAGLQFHQRFGDITLAG